MPLVVPVLRFFVVFLNVYETFKTLKPPPPSARRGGQPSLRAMTQRKRDIKGCLAVWVVWCCYATYEKTFDKVVGIFLPFYSEIKSVFLLFLLLTRAKGAEPLFLHILRPFVKPYTVVLDPILEISRDIGDFLFALLQVPLEYLQPSPWFPSWCTGILGEEPGDSSSSRHINSGGSARTDTHSGTLGDRDAAVWPSRIPSSRHGSIRSVSDSLPSANYPADSRVSHDRHPSTSSLPAYSEHPSHDPPRYSQTMSGHQIWHPHGSSYSTSSHETPIPMHDQIGTAPEYHSPEWRTYPAFPSAYPPTPLPASSRLPNSVNPTGTEHRFVADSVYPPIPEDEQSFRKTPESVLDKSPSSMLSSSNSKVSSRVNIYEEHADVTRQPDEDALMDDSMCSSEAGLSEDDFGSSLMTPHRYPDAIPPGPHSSDDDLPSAVTTTSNATSLRTRTSSESLRSESSSLAGRKRIYGNSNGASPSRRTLSASDSQNTTLTLRRRPAPYPSQSSTSDDDNESEVGGDDGFNVKVKRQRVLDPVKRISTVRPVARGSGSVRHGPVTSRNATVRDRNFPIVSQAPTRTRSGSTTTITTTIRERKPLTVSRPAVRGGPQGIVKTSSTSSSRSGTLKGRA